MMNMNKRDCILYMMNMNKRDCILLNMYGDGDKFTEPVWYSCGKCEKCERIPFMSKDSFGLNTL
jgi:hypothetical protein